MQNIPPVIPRVQESEEQRLEREAREQKQKREEENGVYSDVLNALDGFDVSHRKLTQDELLFLYRFGGNAYDVLSEGVSEENRQHHDRLFRLACEIRDHSADLAVMLGCRRDQIANTPSAVTPETRAYIGNIVEYDENEDIVPLFNLLPSSVEHVYTKFPEKRIPMDNNVIFGGKTPGQTRQELHDQGVIININSTPYLDIALKYIEEGSANVVRLSLADMDLPRGATRREVYNRAKELGLKVNLPPELGPALRLRDKNRSEERQDLLGMKPIPGSHGYSSIFYVSYDHHWGRWLGRYDYEESKVFEPMTVWAFGRVGEE